MSQLHPTDEDDAFARGYADSAQRCALLRVWRLTKLLRLLRQGYETELPSSLRELEREIDEVLATSWRNEVDDGDWRLDEPDEVPPFGQRLDDQARARAEKHETELRSTRIADWIREHSTLAGRWAGEYIVLSETGEVLDHSIDYREVWQRTRDRARFIFLCPFDLCPFDNGEG